MAAPLDGIRVVELANWLAAPAATALLRDLGADVVKIEPPAGDAYRGLETFFKLDHNYAFELDNRGKRSITVDLERPGGPALVRRLAAQADIFVTNLVPQRRERFGLGEAAVRAAKPDLIYVSFTGYGSEGPDSTRAGLRLRGVLGAVGDLGDDGGAGGTADDVPAGAGGSYDGVEHRGGDAGGRCGCGMGRGRGSRWR